MGLPIKNLLNSTNDIAVNDLSNSNEKETQKIQDEVKSNG
jgi:hypothetical protein